MEEQLEQCFLYLKLHNPPIMFGIIAEVLKPHGKVINTTDPTGMIKIAVPHDIVNKFPDEVWGKAAYMDLLARKELMDMGV